MNKVVETEVTTRTPSPLMSEKAFMDMLQGAIGVSPLAVGTKFETDDLIAAVSVRLYDFDWVDYVENAGKPDEREVHFTVWSTIVTDTDGNKIEGYYQGGTVLNKLATAIETKNIRAEMEKYGIGISVSWGKTNSNNKIALITIVK